MGSFEQGVLNLSPIFVSIQRVLEGILLTKKERLVSIFNCLWFGILPSCVYEKDCHYKYSQTYFMHLRYNLKLAIDLVLCREDEKLHGFFKIKWKKYFRWQWE